MQKNTDSRFVMNYFGNPEYLMLPIVSNGQLYKAKELESAESIVKRITKPEEKSDGMMARILRGLI